MVSLLSEELLVVACQERKRQTLRADLLMRLLGKRIFL
jgi:hypothetical protein